LVKQEVAMTKTSNHGIIRLRGENQPADKERAQLAQKIELGHRPPVFKEEANDRD
jgi:adenosine/AMP kinase